MYLDNLVHVLGLGLSFHELIKRKKRQDTRKILITLTMPLLYLSVQKAMTASRHP